MTKELVKKFLFGPDICDFEFNAHAEHALNISKSVLIICLKSLSACTVCVENIKHKP
jgi:hypothetical protein